MNMLMLLSLENTRRVASRIEVEEEEQKSLVEYLDMNLLSYITS